MNNLVESEEIITFATALNILNNWNNEKNSSDDAHDAGGIHGSVCSVMR